jgi:hypothetical protein
MTITTRYISPTTFHGARIKAFCGMHEITIDYDYALSFERAHRKAAMALCSKMDWHDEFIVSDYERGYIYVSADGDRFHV